MVFEASPTAMRCFYNGRALDCDGHFLQFRWNYDGHIIPKNYRNDKRRRPTMVINFPDLRWFPFHDVFNKGESLTKLSEILFLYKITRYNDTNHVLINSV